MYHIEQYKFLNMSVSSSLFIIKTVFAQSPFYDKKVLSRNLPQLTLDEVPCFHKIKIMHNTVLKMNELVSGLYSRFKQDVIFEIHTNKRKLQTLPALI